MESAINSSWEVRLGVLCKIWLFNYKTWHKKIMRILTENFEIGAVGSLLLIQTISTQSNDISSILIADPFVRNAICK